MPELAAGGRRWQVAPGSNLLDALNAAGVAVLYSCRAGSCHACLVRCEQGEPADAQPQALAPEARAEGWRLACQCQVVSDLQVATFDPRRDALQAQVIDAAWPSPHVLRLRVLPQRPLAYRAGQHLVLWLEGVARPYSLASLPGEDRALEFHLDCRQPGAFIDAARGLVAGSSLGLGELHGGALHYDPAWHAQPLWLLAAGTGLAPLYGVLREALRQGHEGPIQLLHVASEHYQRAALEALQAEHPGLQVQYLAQLPASLRVPRRAVALLCGGPASVEAFARALFMAGLPRSQQYADTFTPRR
ncbi:iron-sulfur-binding ferredoxin reductase [Pseudomonas sp. NPDC007930]|uniref:iron-sulfur-binding ferredoxin reductase n=1 Tax=Pseudomonas sp. NPDC007930 TaxID=3364417 RepID=UPI0036E557B9